MKVVAAEARVPDEIDGAFAASSRKGADAVIVAADAFYSGQGRRLAEMSLKRRIGVGKRSRDEAEIARALAEDSVGDVDVAAPRVFDVASQGSASLPSPANECGCALMIPRPDVQHNLRRPFRCRGA
jgi:hypothetical protein